MTAGRGYPSFTALLIFLLFQRKKLREGGFITRGKVGKRVRGWAKGGLSIESLFSFHDRHFCFAGKGEIFVYIILALVWEGWKEGVKGTGRGGIDDTHGWMDIVGKGGGCKAGTAQRIIAQYSTECGVSF